MTVEQNKAIRSLAVEIEQFVNNSNESSTVKIPTVVVEPSSVPQSPQLESNLTEETYFTKVSKSYHNAKSDSTKEENMSTGNCTSKCDPVTETVQLDKLNSNRAEIVVSSIVSDSQPTEPAPSDRKLSPKPPIRSSSSKTTHVKEHKITNIEHTLKTDQISEDSQLDNVVRIVETTLVPDYSQTEEKTSNRKCSPQPPIRSSSSKTEHSKDKNMTNKENTLKPEQMSENAKETKFPRNVVKIVETSTVYKCPQNDQKMQINIVHLML